MVIASGSTQIAAVNLEVEHARLRGAMEAMCELVGLGRLDRIVQQELQTIHDRHPDRLSGEGCSG